MFADAVARRDLDAVLGALTRRRREGLVRQLQGFVAGVARHQDDRIDEYGANRAELRWDADGIRDRIVLRREDDERQVDDIQLRTAPKAERTETDIPKLDEFAD